ncbi:hypothetical protein [Ruegeria sp. HKCCD7255]|uniref:hypothetical protein n=1 Tax=Ruegeria sp. HKCCD7255 TaxID=2683004 RepID=UPI00148934E7|nr:hypothetical protein [Ruegeria sp. HKCCD7255]
MSSQSTETTVRKRRVFYMPGYDPIPPRRYRELYRKESAAQAWVSGYEIALSPKKGDGPYGWHVFSRQDGFETETDIEVLVWSDIVQHSMAQSIPGTYLQLLRTAWIYLSTGTLGRLMRLRKGPVIAALYPVGMLLGQLALAVGIAWASAASLWGWIGWLALLPAFGLAYGLLYAFRRFDNRFFAYYLMHDYAHSSALKGAVPANLSARLDMFSQMIRDALDGDTDEVLVVGHSSGAHLGVLVLASLLRQRQTQRPVSFLSLGQVVPMVSFLPNADQLRRDLQFLSTREDLTWVDVSAPGDGCAFALCDPVAVSGVAGPGKRWPLVLSAAFTQTLSPERWRQLRHRFFRLHFQYLCAFDRPGDYDYFRITAGPLTLAQRFSGRKPSKSRIETPVSKYSSVGP